MEIHFKKLIPNAPLDRIQIQSLISTEKNLFEMTLSKNIKINYLVDAKGMTVVSQQLLLPQICVSLCSPQLRVTS